MVNVYVALPQRPVDVFEIKPAHSALAPVVSDAPPSRLGVPFKSIDGNARPSSLF